MIFHRFSVFACFLLWLITIVACDESLEPFNSITIPPVESTILRDDSVSHMLDQRSQASAASLPTPFDSLGTNFTQKACRTFFSSFLSNATFKSCYPLSMLFQNSQSYFEASASASTLDPVVEASCAADQASCSDFMTDLASNLISSDNCAQDYSLGNPYVTYAHTALVAYEPVYQASCLKDPATQEFCFTELTLNATNLADYWVYLLAVGMPLPSSSQPTCNVCVQATMQIFGTYAQIEGQPLTTTYLPAAQEMDASCGASFVSTAVAVASSSTNGGTSVQSIPLKRLILPLLVAVITLMR